MTRSFYLVLLVLLAFLTGTSRADQTVSFATEYTTIYYGDERDLSRFLQRISGKDIDIHVYPGFAKNRVDRIIEKVQALLAMYPAGFHIDIQLLSTYQKGPIASYSNETKSITTYADRVTESIFAHEVCQALIYAYFKSPPPKKILEILSQYVDRQFWTE